MPIVSIVVDCPTWTCCGVNCWSKFGDEMEVTVSGVALCGCFIAANGPDRYASPTNMVDVNGVWTLNAVLPGDPLNTQWSAVIGTIDLQEFDGAPGRPIAECDGTPIGGVSTVDVTLLVTCSNDFPDDPQGLQAQGTMTNIIGGQPDLNFFLVSPFIQPGDVAPNEITCTTTGGYYDFPAGGGNLTVSPP